MNSTTGALRVNLSTRRITLEDGGKRDEWRIDEVRKASRAYGRPWSILFLEAARALALTPMPPTTTRLLWWAIGNCHPKEWTIAPHGRIAAELGVTRSAITKAMGDLVRRGLLEVGEHGSVRIGLFLAWQGTAQAYQKQRRGRDQAIERARKWHAAERLDGSEAARYFRLADGEPPTPATAPRVRRGGDAKPIGDALASLAGALGFDDDLPDRQPSRNPRRRGGAA